MGERERVNGIPLERRLLVLPAESPDELALARRRTGVAFLALIFSPDFSRIDLPRGELDISSSVSSSSELLEAELKGQPARQRSRGRSKLESNLDEPA